MTHYLPEAHHVALGDAISSNPKTSINNIKAHRLNVDNTKLIIFHPLLFPRITFYTEHENRTHTGSIECDGSILGNDTCRTTILKLAEKAFAHKI